MVPLVMEAVWVRHLSVHEDKGALRRIVHARMTRHAALCVKRGCNILMHRRRAGPSEISLIAARISSLSTLTTPSSNCLQIWNGSSPTIRTAVPSLNGPTSESVTHLPFSKLHTIVSLSNVSVATTHVRGLPMHLTYSDMPATRPLLPMAPKMALRCLASGSCLRIFILMVPWPAITSGSSYRGTKQDHARQQGARRIMCARTTRRATSCVRGQRGATHHACEDDKARRIVRARTTRHAALCM